MFDCILILSSCRQEFISIMNRQSIITLNANQTEGLLGSIIHNPASSLVSKKRKLLVVFIFPKDSAAEHEDSSERPRICTPTDPEGARLSKQVHGKKYAAIDSSGVTSISVVDFEMSDRMELSVSILNDTNAMMQSIQSFMADCYGETPIMQSMDFFMTDCYKRTPHANPNYLQDTSEGFRTLFAINPDGLFATCPPSSVFLVDYHQTSEPQLVFTVDLIGQYLNQHDIYPASEWEKLEGKAMVLQLTRMDGTTYKLQNWGTYKTRKYANIYLEDASDMTSGRYGNGSLTELNRGEFVEVQSLNSVWQSPNMCIHRFVRYCLMGYITAIILIPILSSCFNMIR